MDKSIVGAVLAAMAAAALRSLPASAVLGAHGPTLAYGAWSYAHAAYSDVVALYRYHLLWLHRVPYRDNPIEYPVIIGCFMAAMAYLPGFAGYYWGSVAGLAAAAWAAQFSLLKVKGKTAALRWALSPLLVVFGTLNWDLLGIAAMGFALSSVHRGRAFWAGWWIGIGADTKLFPLILAPFCAAGWWREGSRGAVVQMSLGLAAAVIGVNAPWVVWAEPGWGYLWRFNLSRPPDPGLWQWLAHSGLIAVGGLNVIGPALFIAGALVLFLAVLGGRRDPYVGATAALAWAFFCSKSYSPQYMLWLVYLVLWLPAPSIRLGWVGFVGLLDFGMAMRWLAFGTAAAAGGYAVFVSFEVPAVIALRDGVLLACFFHGLPRLSVPALWPLRVFPSFERRN